MKIETREELFALKKLAIESAAASIHGGSSERVVNMFLELAQQAGVARQAGGYVTVTFQKGGEGEN